MELRTSHAWLLGGPTGVGKTTALRLLEQRLPGNAVLDADDVWRIAPELAIEGTRAIAIANVVKVMQGYFRAGCSHGIVAWVFARPQLYGPVMAGLREITDTVQPIYLTAAPETLAARLEARDGSHRLDYALSRLALIQALPYKKIDTTERTPEEVAEAVMAHILATTT